MGKYEAVSSTVIKRTDRELYFRSVDSAESIEKMLYDEEVQYQVSATNIEIELTNSKLEGNYTDGVLITFCIEPTGDEKCSFFDLIISGVLGTFISDWY